MDSISREIKDKIKIAVVSCINSYNTSKDTSDVSKSSYREIEIRLKDLTDIDVEFAMKYLDNTDGIKTSVLYDVEYYGNRMKNNSVYRRLIYDDRTIMQQKSTHTDKFSITIKNRVYQAIFASSLETDISYDSFSELCPNQTLHKERISYTYDYYRIDITYNSDNRIDFELELIDPLILKKTGKIDNLIKPLIDIFSSINTDDISQEISKLLSNKSSIYTSNKPHAFHRSDIDKLSEYSYTLKSDGTRCNLYRHTTGDIYRIDSYMKVCKIYELCAPLTYLFKQIILDCEYSNGKYTTIDCIYYGGLEKQTYIKRQVLTKKLVEELNVSFISYKPVYLDWSLFSSYNTWFEVKRNLYDGFIFTPIESEYSNKSILKFKDIITIDFVVNDGFVYTKNNSNQLEIFNYKNSGKTNYISDSNVSISKDKFMLEKGPFKVVEMYWKDNIWNYIRDRPDKEYPNHLYVARDNFDAILEDVSLKEVQDYVSKLYPSDILHYIDKNYIIVKTPCLLSSISLSLYGKTQSIINLSPKTLIFNKFREVYSLCSIDDNLSEKDNFSYQKDTLKDTIYLESVCTIFKNINFKKLIAEINHDNTYTISNILRIMKKLYPESKVSNNDEYTVQFVHFYQFLSGFINNKTYDMISSYNIDKSTLHEIEQKLNVSLIILDRKSHMVIYRGIRRDRVILLVNSDLIVVEGKYYLDNEDKLYIDYLYSKDSIYNEY